jgi:hypothetical protein
MPSLISSTVGRSYLCLTVLTLALFTGCIAREADEDAQQVYDGPPPELVVANLTETDLTVALEITAVDQVEAVGVYVTWQIHASILKSYKGELSPGDPIDYRRTIETGSTQPEVGTRHIVSFVLEDGSPMIPDAGYHFPYSDVLDAALSEAAPNR